MIDVTIYGQNDYSIEIKECLIPKPCQWNESTQSIYDFLIENINSKSLANRLFFDLFSQNSVVSILKHKNTIVGILSCIIISNTNDCIIHIRILAIEEKARKSYCTSFFLLNCMYFAATYFKKNVYILVETQYESLFRFLSRHTDIITPRSYATSNYTDDYQLFEEYYSKYIEQQMIFNKDCYYEKENSIIRNYCCFTDGLPYKMDIFRNLNIQNGDSVVIFSRIRNVNAISNVMNCRNLKQFNGAEFIDSCFSDYIKSFGKNEVKVAIIDTGINISNYKNYIDKGIRVYLDVNGIKTDDLYDSKDIHGNITAQIILSYCKNAKLIIIKAFNGKSSCNILELIKSIRLAVDEGAKIVFIGGAVGNTKYLKDLIDVCNYAYEKNTILVAPRDINTQNKSYPFCLDNVIGVSITPFSNLILYDESTTTVKMLHKWNLDFDTSCDPLKPYDVSVGSCIAAAYLTGIISNFISNNDKREITFKEVTDYIKKISISSIYAETYFTSKVG